MRYRPYADDRDRARLLALASVMTRAGSGRSYFHPGDVLWGMYKDTLFDPTASIGMWETGSGELAAFAWDDRYGLMAQLGPSALDDVALLAEMLDWGEVRARSREGDARAVRVSVRDHDAPLLRLVEARGYADVGDTMLHMTRRLDDSVPDTPPAEYRVRAVVGGLEDEARVAIHREVWHPSRVTLEAYRRLQTIPGYHSGLDLVAVAPSGEFASYCICWFDAASATGEFEPVGTRPAFRRRGAGRAVMLEGLRRLKALGARTAIVYSVEANEASTGLYQSVGFEPVGRYLTYAKKL